MCKSLITLQSYDDNRSNPRNSFKSFPTCSDNCPQRRQIKQTPSKLVLSSFSHDDNGVVQAFDKEFSIK